MEIDERGVEVNRQNPRRVLGEFASQLLNAAWHHLDICSSRPARRAAHRISESSSATSAQTEHTGAISFPDESRTGNLPCPSHVSIVLPGLRSGKLSAVARLVRRTDWTSNVKCIWNTESKSGFSRYLRSVGLFRSVYCFIDFLNHIIVKFKIEVLNPGTNQMEISIAKIRLFWLYSICFIICGHIVRLIVLLRSCKHFVLK